MELLELVRSRVPLVVVYYVVDVLDLTLKFIDFGVIGGLIFVLGRVEDLVVSEVRVSVLLIKFILVVLIKLQDPYLLELTSTIVLADWGFHVFLDTNELVVQER